MNNICKKCKKILNSLDYPDKVGGYELLIKSEIFCIYKCLECGTNIMNSHKRRGYQSEYLPYNSIVDDEEYERLKVLNTLPKE
jgi:DNA-directed RNA polymerase subunit RPC12/RpoP